MLWISFRMLLFFILPSFYFVHIVTSQGCDANYESCSPPGASDRDLPAMGPDLGRLYLDLIQMLQTTPQAPIPSSAINGGKTGLNIICCAQGTECRLVPEFNIPACWDRFTTDVFLPNGAYGSLANGSFLMPSGVLVNLITGVFNDDNGNTGNIYKQDPTAIPNTFTLPMPIPYTSKGVGTAIPASELGGIQSSFNPTTECTTQMNVSATQYPSVMTYGLTSSNTSTNSMSYGQTVVPHTTFSPLGNTASKMIITNCYYALMIFAAMTVT